MTNVLIVEDQTMPRMLFEMFVSQSENYHLAASISNADMAEYHCENSNINLILMDICTAMGANGLNAAQRIKKRFPQIKIIIVTSMPEYSYLKRAREAGVDSFWYKEVSREPIIEIMDRTMNGESVFPDTTPEIQFGNASSYDFSERELEVLRELTSGDTNTEIAKRLFISAGTVKNHIQHMLEKTGFKSRTELAVKAREAGIVILDRSEDKK